MTKAASFSPSYVRFVKSGQSISCRGLENVRFASQGAWSDGAVARRLSGLADRSSADGWFLPRREFARPDGSQQLAQAATAPRSQHLFKSPPPLRPPLHPPLHPLP